MNRFNQPVQNAGYTPLSFQELSFAPIQMRQREDRLNDQKDLILSQMDNIVGYEGFDEETNALKGQMKKKLEDLSSKIQKNGAGNMAYLDEFRGLRNEYNSLVSKTGALGMSSAIKESLDSQREAFFKLGLQHNQSPEAIEANWQKEIAKYKAGMPSKLGELKGQIPAFNPMLPPEDQDLPTHMAKLNTMLGSVTDKYQGMKFIRNAEGKIVPVDVQGVEITNEPNLDAMMDIVENEVLDPKSKIHQDMLFKGYTPEEYLNKVANFKPMILETSSSTSMDADKKSTSTSSSSSSDSEEEKEQASWLDTANSSERIKNSHSSRAIEQEIDNLNRNTYGLSEDERQHRLTTYKSIYKSVKDAEEGFKSQVDENGVNLYEKAMDKELANNSLLLTYGITTMEKFHEAMKNPEKYQPGKSGVPISAGNDDQGVPLPVPPLNRQTLQQAFNEVDDVVLKRELNPKLADSKQMTLGPGTADEKVEKVLINGLKKGQLLSAAMNNRLEVAGDNPADLNFTTLGPKDEGFDDFYAMLNQGNAELTFEAINSGSMYSTPELQYTLHIPGEDADDPGYTKQFTIDMGKDDFSQSILDPDGPVYKAMDPESQAVMNNMRENIEYMGVPTSSPYDLSEPNIFMKKNQEGIIKHAKQRDQELFKIPVLNTDDPNDLEKLMLDSRFIKEEKDVQYAVTINGDGSYSSHKKLKDGTILNYTIGDYFNKDFTAAYALDNMNDPNAAKNLSTPKGIEYKNKHKRVLMDKILSNASDITKPGSNMLIYSNNAKFRNALTEYNKFTKSGATQEQITRKAIELFDVISTLPVQSKRKNMVL